MRTFLLLSTFCAGAYLGLTNPAFGQGFDAEVRMDQLQPPSPGSPFTRAEGPFEPFDTGIGYGFHVVGDYAYRPFGTTVDGGEEERFPVEHALLLHVGASLVPRQWLLLEASFPAAIYEDGE